MEVYLFWTLQLPYLVPCAAVILFKSSQDIIQGVSKLDYLHKVSIFQMYKDEVMQTTKNIVIKSTKSMLRKQSTNRQYLPNDYAANSNANSSLDSS